MSFILSKSYIIDSVGSKCVGDGLPLSFVCIAALAHYSRTLAPFDMAIPQRRPSGCGFSIVRDIAPYLHAEWASYPHVES